MLGMLHKSSFTSEIQELFFRFQSCPLSAIVFHGHSSQSNLLYLDMVGVDWMDKGYGGAKALESWLLIFSCGVLQIYCLGISYTSCAWGATLTSSIHPTPGMRKDTWVSLTKGLCVNWAVLNLLCSSHYHMLRRLVDQCVQHPFRAFWPVWWDMDDGPGGYADERRIFRLLWRCLGCCCADSLKCGLLSHERGHKQGEDIKCQNWLPEVTSINYTRIGSCSADCTVLLHLQVPGSSSFPSCLEVTECRTRQASPAVAPVAQRKGRYTLLQMFQTELSVSCDTYRREAKTIAVSQRD